MAKERPPEFHIRVLKQILSEWRHDRRAPLDRVIKGVFDEYRVGSKERKTLANAAYQGVRYWTTVFGAGLQFEKPDSQRAFQSGVERLLLGIKNSELEKKHGQLKPKFERDARLHLEQHHEVPTSLIQSWNLSEVELLHAFHDYLHASLAPAPLCLRVNSLRSSKEELRAHFPEVAFRDSTFAPNALLTEAGASLLQSSAFQEGCFEIQDESSQVLSHIISPNKASRVLDFCAGAGGKTLHLAELVGEEGKVHAFDVESAKLKELAKRAERLGLENIKILQHAPKASEKYDVVLLDVPCSSLGNLRRNPDRVQKFDSWKKAQIQSEVLLKAAQWVKPGGLFVYATCTIRPQENVLKLKEIEPYLQSQYQMEPYNLFQHLVERWGQEMAEKFGQCVQNSLAHKLRYPSLKAYEKEQSAHALQWSFSSPQELENRHLSGAIEGDGFFVSVYNKKV